MRGKHSWRTGAAAAAVFSALGLALAIGFYPGSGSAPGAGQVPVRDEDALAISSSGRILSNPGAGQDSAGNSAAAAQGQKEAEAQTAQMLAAQQAAQQAALTEQQRQLQLQSAQQAAQEQQLEEERQRIAAEKQQADAAAAEAARQQAATAAAAAAAAERLKQQAQSRPQPAYSGPSSGNIVWRGEVQGTTLVTIEGNSSDTGQVISGALPGVLVMVQPADAKHVGVAGAPAPSNGYRRLTLRVQGKGVMQAVIHWSIP